MKLITVHVLKNDYAMIRCPFCELRKRVSAHKIRNIKHKITVRCQCENRFEVQFNFRENYRKNVEIAGVFMTVSSDVSTERKMHVFDLSRSGLSFKMIDTVDVKKGDELFVRFNLDDAKQSLIHKKVVVKLINDKFLGCEFTDLDRYEKELGFYLLA